MSSFLTDFFITWVAVTLIFMVLSYALNMTQFVPREALVGSIFFGFIYSVCDALGMMPL